MAMPARGQGRPTRYGSRAYFYCMTPKTRHRAFFLSTVDWTIILDSNFGDPYRTDKRLPGPGDHQLHMNLQAHLGIEDGDVYVDANPADRPYGLAGGRSFLQSVALMLRQVQPAYPYHCHAQARPFMATEVGAHMRPGPTGWRSRRGRGIWRICATAPSSRSRDWSMPMHQTDTLFHKQKTAMQFISAGGR